jgi:hypothetical protein
MMDDNHGDSTASILMSEIPAGVPVTLEGVPLISSEMELERLQNENAALNAISILTKKPPWMGISSVPSSLFWTHPLHRHCAFENASAALELPYTGKRNKAPQKERKR